MSNTRSDNAQSGTLDNNKKPHIFTDKDGNIVEYCDADGFHAIRYRDEYVGGVWLTPNGTAAPDVVTVTIGGVSTQMYAFDGSTTEERLANNFEIAHDLPLTLVNDGTLKLEFHGHVRPSTNNSGTAKLFFDWCYTPVNGAPIAQTSLSFDIVIGANQQYYHFMSGVELPVPVGGYGIGSIITFNLRRTPTTTGDNYPDDLLLIKCALHVPTDGDGSRQRYIK